MAWFELKELRCEITQDSVYTANSWNATLRTKMQDPKRECRLSDIVVVPSTAA